MNDNPQPIQPVRVVALPPPPISRVSLPPDYQRAHEFMRMAQEAAIPVAKMAGVAMASSVLVAVPVSRPAPNARTEPIAMLVRVDDPVAAAMAEPVVIVIAEAVDAPKPPPASKFRIGAVNTDAEPPKEATDPSSRLW